MDGSGLKMDFKINVIGLANLLALVGILATALGTFYSLAGEVRLASADINMIRTQLEHDRGERKEEITALRNKDDFILDNFRTLQEKTSEKLYAIDSKVQVLQSTSLRVEQILNDFIKKENLP